MAGYNSSDLTSILNALSALSKPPAGAQNPSVHQPYNSTTQIQQPSHDGHDDDAYEPPDIPAAPAPSTSKPHPQPQPHLHPHQPHPQHAKPTETTSTTDPSTITTWSSALRHVMRTVSQDETLQRRIRRLMQSQHDHEKQWWQGREALCKKQKARGDKKKELDEVLRSVGAPVDSSKGVSTAEEDQTELNTYDAKIYTASNQMAQALTLELRGLGIPFFSIKRDLVTDDHKNNDDHDKQHKDKLPRDELSALQLRMLELLQDLCKE